MDDYNCPERGWTRPALAGPGWAPPGPSGTMSAVSAIPDSIWFYALSILAVGSVVSVAAWLCRGSLRHREQALEVS